MSAKKRIRLMVNLTDGETGRLVGQELVYADETDKRRSLATYGILNNLIITTIQLGEESE